MTVDLIRFVLKTDPPIDYKMIDDNNKIIQFGEVCEKNVEIKKL